MLEKRPHDGSNFPINGYSFTSVHTWGENPQGDWIIQIADEVDAVSSFVKRHVTNLDVKSLVFYFFFCRTDAK